MVKQQVTVGGTIVCVNLKIIMVLGKDLNLYVVNFETKKGLRNPNFKEGLCVDVIYLSPDGYKVEDIVMVLPLGENDA